MNGSIAALRMACVFAAVLTVTPAVQAAVVTFQVYTIDADNSGDTKALADIDGDGQLDPILGGSSLAWYQRAPAGYTYARYVIRAGPVHQEFTTDMQAGDIDGDGDPDIVVGDGSGRNNVLWFENPRINPPAGKASAPTVADNWTYHAIGSHGQSAHDLGVGDINNDGKLDVVSGGHGYMHIWFQNGSNGWSDKDLSGLWGGGLCLGQIKATSGLDIAIGTGWLEKPADPVNGTWIKHVIDGAAGETAAIGDFNYDGRNDVVVAIQHAPGKFAWYEAPSDPTGAGWIEHVLDGSQGSHKINVADFNKDGRPDIQTGLELTDLSIYLSLGGVGPAFEREQVSGGPQAASHNARVGDLNGDGWYDIFGCDYIGNPPARVWIIFVLGDANQDGLVDGQDFTILKANFGANGGWAQGNFNEDTIVDGQDFTILKAYFGQGTPLGGGPAVPEPTSLLLLALPALVAQLSKLCKPTGTRRGE